MHAGCIFYSQFMKYFIHFYVYKNFLHFPNGEKGDDDVYAICYIYFVFKPINSRNLIKCLYVLWYRKENYLWTGSVHCEPNGNENCHQTQHFHKHSRMHHEKKTLYPFTLFVLGIFFHLFIHSSFVCFFL
jgi:hypothetical protein